MFPSFLLFMENALFLPRTEELEARSKRLGFLKTFFQEDFLLLSGGQKKVLLQKALDGRRKGKLVVYRCQATEDVRYVLEKVPVQLVLGLESVHRHDSLHHLRSGLDQVLCRIAAEKRKIITFSFADVLKYEERWKLLRRMQFNVQLCRKFKIPLFFSTFSSSPEEMRAAQDLLALWRLLGGRKEEMSLPVRR